MQMVLIQSRFDITFPVKVALKIPITDLHLADRAHLHHF